MLLIITYRLDLILAIKFIVSLWRLVDFCSLLTIYVKVCMVSVYCMVLIFRYLFWWFLMFRVISFNTCMLKAIIFFSLFMSFFIIVFMYILVFLVIMWMMEEDILFRDMFYCFIFIMGFMFMVMLNIICKKE